MDQGMITMDRSLANLVKSGVVAMDTALAFAKDPKNFKMLLH
jgi:Tfp pilus assembly pilus retraction ATPase PilT